MYLDDLVAEAAMRGHEGLLVLAQGQRSEGHSSRTQHLLAGEAEVVGNGLAVGAKDGVALAAVEAVVRLVDRRLARQRLPVRTLFTVSKRQRSIHKTKRNVLK